jgi:1-acyl-sn-glycerol-3-phosphate acyltransferase
MSLPFPQVGMSFVYGFFHYGMGVLCDIHFHAAVSGVENVPREGGFIVAANHVSLLDPPIVGSFVPRQICAFARRTLWKGGLSSWWLDAVGVIPVDREAGSDVTAIRRVIRVLQANRGIIVFPEGTRSPTGRLQPPKAGVGLMACRTGVPVVPARIFGSFEAFGRNRPLRLGTPIAVVFGRPLRPEDYDDRAPGKERYQHASERIMAAIAALELRPPKVV